ncbi:MAG TPA: hypothetical protein VF974_08015 [Patescibacteria group bacterium]
MAEEDTLSINELMKKKEPDNQHKPELEKQPTKIMVAENPITEPYKKLLLAPKQEEQKRHESPTWPLYDYNCTDPQGSTIFVEGYAHVASLNEQDNQGNTYQKIVEKFHKEHPDILLVEGSSDEVSADIMKEEEKRIKEGQLPFTDEEVIERYREQIYLAWKARKEGIEVKSWDIPFFIQQAEYARGRNSQDAIVGWAIGQGANHILSEETTQEVTPGKIDAIPNFV